MDVKENFLDRCLAGRRFKLLEWLLSKSLDVFGFPTVYSKSFAIMAEKQESGYKLTVQALGASREEYIYNFDKNGHFTAYAGMPVTEKDIKYLLHHAMGVIAAKRGDGFWDKTDRWCGNQQGILTR